MKIVTKGAYSLNSTYRANLNVLLSTLSSNATVDNGFYNYTAGGGATNAVHGATNAVHGLFLCRGDVTSQASHQCVESARREILQLCPNETRAIAFYDDCLLRYSDRSIFSIPDQSLRFALNNTQSISDPNRFLQVLGQLMIDTAGEAVNSQSGKRFATREVNFTSFLRVYALAQCTPDLSSAECSTCLQDAIATLPSCCYGRRAEGLCSLAVFFGTNCTAFTGFSPLHRHRRRPSLFLLAAKMQMKLRRRNLCNLTSPRFKPPLETSQRLTRLAKADLVMSTRVHLLIDKWWPLRGCLRTQDKVLKSSRMRLCW